MKGLTLIATLILLAPPGVANDPVGDHWTALSVGSTDPVLSWLHQADAATLPRQPAASEEERIRCFIEERGPPACQAGTLPARFTAWPVRSHTPSPGSWL